MVNPEMLKLGTSRSAIRELFEFGKEQAQILGEDAVFDFSLGNPSTPPPNLFLETLEHLLSEDPVYVHSYTSAQGDVALRQSLASYLSEKNGTIARADDFYITCGAAASLTISIKALIENSNDEFIAIAPFFPEYRVFVEGNGGKFKFVEADLENFQINFEALEKTITPNTKAVLINSPNNPSGVIYTKETLQTLSKLLTKKSNEYDHPILIISDEPYREIYYTKEEPTYIPHVYPNTIICYSYSKSLSLPGERIGYIQTPEKLVQKDQIYSAILGAGRTLGYVCAPSLFQKAVARTQGCFSDIAQYIENRNLLTDGLTKLGYEFVEPNGAFYLFVKALEKDAEIFSKKAQQFGLLLVPSNSFGVEGYVRVSYCVNSQKIARSIPQFEKLKKLYQ